MRTVRLLVFASFFPAGGCAALIAQSGTDLDTLKTKEKIHALLGEPVACGVADGKAFEEYHTRRKISDHAIFRLGEGYFMAWTMTCGAIDLYCVPHELYLVGRNTLLGQKVRVTYDGSGTVTSVFLDSNPLAPWHLNGTADSQEGGGSEQPGNATKAVPPESAGPSTSRTSSN
jgi:hypothetical protein